MQVAELNAFTKTMPEGYARETIEALLSEDSDVCGSSPIVDTVFRAMVLDHEYGTAQAKAVYEGLCRALDERDAVQ